jgi:hypothetical protein
MRALGYMYKRVESRPDWLGASHVADIYSLSGCISEDFADYIPFWRHNGFWLFDSPAIIRAGAAQHGVSLAGLKLFYYEAYEEEYDRAKHAWAPFAPEASFVTNIEGPAPSGWRASTSRPFRRMRRPSARRFRATPARPPSGPTPTACSSRSRMRSASWKRTSWGHANPAHTASSRSMRPMKGRRGFPLRRQD